MSGRATEERELKFAVPWDFELPEIDDLVGGFSRLPERRLDAQYFDTPDVRLWQRNLTFRHRFEGTSDDGTWTLKLPSGVRGPSVDRTELTWPGTREAFPAEALDILAGILRRMTLEPVAQLLTTRQRWVLRDTKARSWGELDDDRVVVLHEQQGGPRFRQIELELEPVARDRTVDAVSQALQQRGARQERIPKLARALQLADHDDGRGRSVGAHSPMTEVVTASLTEGLARLLDHDYRLRLNPSEWPVWDVHQSRVATRRLRADLKLLQPELDPVWVRHTRRDLKWFGMVLGAVRDVDALSNSLSLSDRVTSTTEAGGLLELRSSLESQRRSAGRILNDALNDDRYLMLLDRLHAASLRPPLRAGQQPGNRRSKGRRGDARVVLPHLVRHRWVSLKRAVKKAGSHPTDRQLHQIRIKSKQLRYAAESAQAVVGRPARRTAKAAEDIQTILGEHHDAMEAETWLRHQATTGTRSAAFAAGTLVVAQQQCQQDLRSQWRAVWKVATAKKGRRWLH